MRYNPKNIDAGFHDPRVQQNFIPKAEIDELNEYIKHDRDEVLTYAAMEQFRGKYPVQNRATGEIFETPKLRI